ncbi:MAG TPA: hypothetical protein VF517_16480 [Thermoleophilaceae bacterium]|jgi:hypothetical protein
MALLTVLLTHLGRAQVEAQLAQMRALAPDGRFVAVHGGRRSDFDGLDPADALFVEDPSLRGPHFDKSLNDTLRAIHDRWVRDDPDVDLVYLVEYDHVILRGDFEAALRDVVARTGAGLVAKNATPRNDTNWSHFLKVRGDERLDRYIESITTRDDPLVRWGCLGTGLLLTRDALSAFRALDEPPPHYVEMFVPTAVHHLGFHVVDMDAVSDLYADVRWLPEFGVEEALAAKRAGRHFVHPFKRLDELAALSA